MSKTQSFKIAEELKVAQTSKVKLQDFLASKIHEAFTLAADRLAQSGQVTQEERIELSNNIGDALDTFNENIDSGVGSKEVEVDVEVE